MLDYCLNCDYENEIKPDRSGVTVTVRGEDFEVTEEFYKCPVCEEKFTSSLGHDALDEAYREYRRRHDMLQPEEIRHWRENYGLTQIELSRLLEWEAATLSRYENGALQEKSEDTLLKFIMAPQNLLNLITSKPHILSVEKQNQLLAQLSANKTVAKHVEQLYTVYNKPNKLGERNQSGVSKQIITSEPFVQSSIPVFANTSVPVKTLIDYFKGGKSVNNFLDGFPTVSREQVMAFLSELEKQIIKQAV
jgi:putative zinc finger/helix-turn-helix YgiT family protein